MPMHVFKIVVIVGTDRTSKCSDIFKFTYDNSKLRTRVFLQSSKRIIRYYLSQKLA